MVNSEPVKPAFDTHASSLKNDNLEALLDFRFRVGRAYCHRICLGWEAKHGASIQIGFYSPSNCFLIWSLGGKNQVNQTRPAYLTNTLNHIFKLISRLFAG